MRRRGGGAPKVPDFPIEDVADAYTYYVSILGTPESMFWDADVWLVRAVAENKAAYDRWHADAMSKQMKRGTEGVM